MGQTPTEIRVAVPRDKYTETVKSLIACFFYVVDKFPDRVRAQYLEQTAMWRVLLGHAIWPGDHSEGKLLSDVCDHFDSLGSYLDPYSHAKLVEIGLPCEDIYDLLFKIIENFNSWMMNSTDSVSTMYGKELNVLMFVCSDFINAINNMSFKLASAAKKDMSLKHIENVMKTYLKPGLMFALKNEHGEVSTTFTSGDNMALKITNLLVPQTKSTKSASARNTVINDPALFLHASIAEVGGYRSMPKASPDGRSRLNLRVQIGPTGLIMRSKTHERLLDDVQQMIRRDNLV